MFLRLLTALLTSPFYGALALLATLPLVILGALSLSLAGRGITQGMAAEPGMADAVLVLALGLANLAFQIAIIVQIARYAASISGAAPLRTQPSFVKACIRGALILVLLGLVLGMILVALSLFGIQLLPDPGDTAGLAADELALLWANALQGYLFGTAPDDPRVVWIAQAVEIATFLNFVFMMILAALLVPAVTGLGAGGGDPWSAPMMVARVFLFLPGFILTSLMISELALGLVELALSRPLPFRPLLIFIFQTSLFNGMAFALEALLLKATREDVAQTVQIAEEISREPDQYRELRLRRTGRPGP